MKAGGLNLTIRDKILVHLTAFAAYEKEAEVPPHITQEGIARATGARQRHIRHYVRPLIARGLVEERASHIQGGKQRRSAYFLTTKGRQEATRLRRHLLDKLVEVELEDGPRTMSLRTALEGPLKGGLLMELLGQLERHGRLGSLDDLRSSAWPEVQTLPKNRGPWALRSPLVDRSSELARLHQSLEALNGGKGGCILLTGEAGIGKSRLAWELSVEASWRGVLFIEGRSVEVHGPPPLIPWIEVLRSLRSTLPPAQLRELLTPYSSVLVRFIPDLPVWIGHAVPASSPPPEFERFQLFDAVTQILTGLSRKFPLVLFIDDLQWADEGSAQLLAYVRRNTLDERILLIGSYRPEEVPAESPLAATLFDLNRVGRVDQIALGPLDPEEVRQLVKGVLLCERVHPNLASILSERGNGNPFFIQELIFSLQQEGRIAVEGGEAVLRGSGVRLPGSMVHLIRRRLARLSSPAREMLMKGSVLGRQLRPEVMAGMLGKEWDAILDMVDEALASRLLREDPAKPHDSLLFADEWVQECIYDMISETRRRSYHRRAAEILASIPETPPDELGYHCAKAGLAELATKYLEAAGDEAMTLSSFKRAIERFERALQFLPSEGGEVHGRLLKKLGDAYAGAGKSNEARGAYLHARQYVKSREEDAAIGVRLAEVLVTMWDVPALHEELGHTLRVLGDAKTPDASWAYNLHSFVLADMDGDPDGSARAAERALEISSALGDREQLLQALDNLTWAHVLACGWERARTALLRLEEAIQEGARPEQLASRYISLGIYYSEVFPDYGKAVEYFQRALEILRRTGNDSAATTAQYHLGFTDFHAGLWADGERNLLAALAVANELPESRNEVPPIQVLLALVMASRGDFARAERDILAALGSREWYERFHSISFAYAALAWVRGEAGNWPGAREAIRESFEVIQEHGGCGRCSCYAWPVAAYIETLDPEGDEQHFREAEQWVAEKGNPFAKVKMRVLAVSWARLHDAPTEEGMEESQLYFQRIDDPFELASALYEHGLTLIALGSKSRAEACLDEAQGIFSELGAKKRLEDVRRSRQRLTGHPLSV